MNSREAYERHLAHAAPGTALRASMARVGSVDVTAEDLIEYARWEMWEAIFSLPPESALKDDPRHATGDATRITDGFHASCCVSRAESALRQLAKLLAARVNSGMTGTGTPQATGDHRGAL